jgi:hypothetical protein
MALPEDILTTINNIDRRLKNLERSPQPPNIVLSNYMEWTKTIGANSHDTRRFILQAPNNARVLAIPEITIYHDSVSSDNEYPYAPGWVYAEALNFHIHWWFDEFYSDDNNLHMMLNLTNNNATPQTIVARVRFRYLQSSGTTGSA